MYLQPYNNHLACVVYLAILRAEGSCSSPGIRFWLLKHFTSTHTSQSTLIAPHPRPPTTPCILYPFQLVPSLPSVSPGTERPDSAHALPCRSLLPFHELPSPFPFFRTYFLASPSHLFIPPNGEIYQRRSRKQAFDVPELFSRFLFRTNRSFLIEAFSSS